MTRTRYRRKASPVRVSDWTAAAFCPDCGDKLVTYRLSPEREGFYMVSAESPRHDPTDHIAIVKSFALAKATAVCAAELAALTCPRCFHKLVAQVRPTLSVQVFA